MFGGFWRDKEIIEWKNEVINNFINSVKLPHGIFDALYESASFNNPEVILSLSKI